MANHIEPANIKASNFVTPTSRYYSSQVIYYSEKHLVAFETYKRPALEVGADDRFMVIPASRQYRPDLVSYQVYGDVDFWWKIMEINQMSDILQFKTGANIRLPRNIYS